MTKTGQSGRRSRPPPGAKMRSPRNGGNRARAGSQIEVVNEFPDTLTSRRVQALKRTFALTQRHAEVIASLYFQGVVAE